MKKLLAFTTSLLAVIACCFVAACFDKEPVTVDENSVIITASASSFDYENKTLKDYMDYLKENGKLSYTIRNGMVTEINGISQTTNSFWMLYTDDAENASDEWGIEYDGKIYGSANLGAEALAVKEGCIYIWAYQTF